MDPDPYLKLSNMVVYRALIHASKAAAAGVTMDFSERPVCLITDRKHAIVFAIRGSSLMRRSLCTFHVTSYLSNVAAQRRSLCQISYPL